MSGDIINQFRSALAARSLIPPEQLEADGRIHRCDAEGKNGKGDGAYLLHLDGVAAGGINNHSDGIGWQDWRADIGRVFTPAEEQKSREIAAAARLQREEAAFARRGAAELEARVLLRKAKPASPSHPYLRRKGVKPHVGVVASGGDLLVPMSQFGKGVLNLQRIDDKGQKRFLPGGEVRGCFFLIGKKIEEQVFVVEGYATGASVYEATGMPVVVAFNCGNLLPVAQAVRGRRPGVRIVICADDDAATAGNPGLMKANEAAHAVGGTVVAPLFGESRPEGATDFNDMAGLLGVDAVKRCLDAAVAAHGDEDHEDDLHRNAPVPDPACLYGLIGEIARAGSATTEANPYAIALNAITYLSCAFGRVCYLPVGNTWHHCRIFTLHVGRTGRGRKGDAVSLIHRLDKAIRTIDPAIAPQVHRGGLSSREGLAFMIHDGYREGKNEVPAIDDKRLVVFESEFANVTAQNKREGNTLSAALRDAWDGISIRPATKTSRTWATDPHICLGGAITPGELRGTIAARDLSNGFANRFLMIWAERTRMLPFPVGTEQALVDELALKIVDALRAAGADRFVEKDECKVELTVAARERYHHLYLNELNDQSAGDAVNALLERRAPVLLRIAMLFALCDKQLKIDLPHINAAHAWIRYWTDSVKYIFATAVDEAGVAETNETAEKIAAWLQSKNGATRTELTRDCFQGHVSKDKIDVALDELLSESPPRIVVESVPRPKDNPGAPTKRYRLAANTAKSAKSEHPRGFAGDSRSGELSDISEVRSTSVRSVRTVREVSNQPQTRASAGDSLNSHGSQGNNETAVDAEAF